MRIRTPAAGALALTLFVVPVRSELLIVDSSATAHTFATIQAAVDTAHDGDVVLVRSGAYGGFVVVDKDLSIVADVTGGAKVHGAVAVMGLAAGKTVVLGGLDVSLSAPVSALRAHDNEGLLWIEDCQFLGGPGRACVTPEPAVSIELCQRVAFIRSSLFAASAGKGQGSGGDALHVADSSAALHMCRIVGGTASFESCGAIFDGGDGGSATRITGGSQVYSSGVTFHGANGAAGVHGGAGGDGGHGLTASSSSELATLGVEFSAGIAGLGCGRVDCADGSAGVALDGDPVHHPGFAPYVSGAPPVLQGTSSTMVLYGDGGDRVLLRIADEASFEFDADVRGVQLVRGGRILSVGQLPQSGAAGAQLFVPYLAPPGGAQRYFVQAIHRSTSGVLSFGGVRAMVALGGAP
ncbi:MAG: hypothetical protein ACKVWV_04815 [Planctomycetota bacterium]